MQGKLAAPSLVVWVKGRRAPLVVLADRRDFGADRIVILAVIIR